MSNYNVADKVEGDDWTSGNHNAMKEAINSKLDAVALVSDPNAPPSNSTVFSSSVINTLFGNPATYFKLLGTLSVSDDLSLLIGHGYYIIENVEIPSTNTSYPDNITQYRWGGAINIYSEDTQIVQVLTLNGSNAGTGTHSRIFTNYSNDGGDNWDGWEEFVNMAWLVANLPQLLPAGAPTITGGTADLSVTPHSCTDTKGQITLLNTSGSILPAGSNITITYQIARPYASIVLLSTYMETDLKVTSYSPPTSTSCIIRLNEDLPIGGNTSFYYHIL